MYIIVKVKKQKVQIQFPMYPPMMKNKEQVKSKYGAIRKKQQRYVQSYPLNHQQQQKKDPNQYNG